MADVIAFDSRSVASVGIVDGKGVIALHDARLAISYDKAANGKSASNWRVKENFRSNSKG
jgi:hypothetical protein